MTHLALLLGSLVVASGPVGASHPGSAPVLDEPLLVIVERSNGATVSPEQVRRAIAEELGRRVVGPGDAAGKSASQMLIVTLAPDSVSVQLRMAGDAAPRRHIEPLAGGEANLRVVAWLAGNLARDQAGELMDARPGTPVVAPAPPPAPVETPDVPAPPPGRGDAETPTVRTAERHPGPSEDAAPWRLELSFGRALKSAQSNWYSDLPTRSFERLEVLGPSRPGHWSWEAGIDVIDGDSSDGDIHSYVVSGAFARRFEIVPGWLAADVAFGEGFIYSRGTGTVPVGNLGYYGSGQSVGPYLLGRAGAGLAIVRMHVGEIVMSARVFDALSRASPNWKEPFFTTSVGFRLALQ